MSKPPAFQFYAQDFLVGTADMTAEEVGVYIRLLCYQWAKGGVVNDAAKLAKLTGCGLIVAESVMAKFEMCEDGMLRNDRLESIRLSAEAFRARQAEAAKNAWAKRLANGKPMASHKLTNDEPEDSLCSSSSSSSSIKDIGANESHPAEKMSDSEWLAELETSEAYRGIDVKREFAKLQAWCGVHRKQPSRRRFINWINRIEKPMQAAPQHGIRPTITGNISGFAGQPLREV